MNSRRFFLGWVLALCGWLLSVNVAAQTADSAPARSDVLLEQQFAAADLPHPPGPRLIFAGFAMHSQSTAFRNDVLAVERLVLAIDPHAVVFKLNNPAQGQPADWPQATARNIALVMKKVSALARAEDKVVVLMSTHGNVDILSINIDNQYREPIRPVWLNQALTDLRGKPALVLLSACYSGSFVAPLSAPDRVILTAAAKDRASFGCDVQSSNTYFIDALVNQPAPLERSIVQIMERARTEVDERERRNRLSPPSRPQMFIGQAVEEWASRPLANLLAAP